MVLQPQQTCCSGLSEKGEQQAGLSVSICARLCRREAVRKGILQQIQLMPAKALSTMTCSAAWNWHWPKCYPELILTPNWWLALFIETTKAKQKTSKTEFYGTNPKGATGDPRPAAAMNGAGSVCIFCLPPFYPDWLADRPTQLTNPHTRCCWLLILEQNIPKSQQSHFILHSRQLSSPGWSKISPQRALQYLLACLAKASCDKRLHRYHHVLETQDNE